jgi:hypothetical protein
MGRNINWSRKIIFIILLFSNLAYTQHNKFNSNNILILVQIESVKEDTVKFKTIEIYNKTCWISINKIKVLHLFHNIKHNSHKLSKTKIQQYFQIEILITKTK